MCRTSPVLRSPRLVEVFSPKGARQALIRLAGFQSCDRLQILHALRHRLGHVGRAAVKLHDQPFGAGAAFSSAEMCIIAALIACINPPGLRGFRGKLMFDAEKDGFF